MKHRLLGILALMLLISTVLSFVTIPQEAEASATITASITSAVGQVEVYPGAPGSVSYYGAVAGTFIGTTGTQANPVTVSLTATCSEGGSAVCSPSTVLLTTVDDTAEINIYVRLPPGTTYTVTPIIRLTGTWMPQIGAGGTVPETTQAVEILQYSWTNIESATPYMETKPGDAAIFSLKLNNLGNGEETYIIDITNPDDLQGWILPPRQRLTVAEKAPKTYTLSLSSPQKFTIWKNEVKRVELKVTSDALGKIEQYDLYVRMKGFYLPGFEPAFAIMAMAIVATMVKHQYNKKASEEQQIQE